MGSLSLGIRLIVVHSFCCKTILFFNGPRKFLRCAHSLFRFFGHRLTVYYSLVYRLFASLIFFLVSSECLRFLLESPIFLLVSSEWGWYVLPLRGDGLPFLNRLIFFLVSSEWGCPLPLFDSLIRFLVSSECGV